MSEKPAILKRLISQLVANGMSKGQAIAVATKKLQESGNLKKGSTEATAKGKKRGAMTPAQRAKDRAAKDKGGKASDYKYNKKNNSAVKGKVNKNVKRKK
jgi:uncharacterized protein YoaH (UPF0181 family)